MRSHETGASCAQPTLPGGEEARQTSSTVASFRAALPDWSVSASWNAISDHAALTFRRGTRPSATRFACSPARFWALPEEARVDLRRNWGYIAHALKVAASTDPTPTLSRPRIQEPGEPANDDPIDGPLPSPTAHAPSPDTETYHINGNAPTPAPLVAHWGHSFTTAAFNAWWKKWCKVQSRTSEERSELARIARSSDNCAHDPSPTLAAWLSAMGGPEALTPAEAQHWLGILVCLEDAALAATRYSRGPNAHRPGPSRKIVAGRAVHKAKFSNTNLVTDAGEQLTSSQAKGEALIRTREHIWFDRVECTPDVTALLRAYAHSRGHRVTTSPLIDHAFLRSCILAAAGTAPGVDSAPYEVYHLHPQLFAVLLEQAFCIIMSSHDCDPIGCQSTPLDRMLGPAIDLLVWIPKKLHDTRVSQQRPLQLPTCTRRLFGSACARILGPALEPSLEPAQAAIAGGHCYQNIARAHTHTLQTQRTLSSPLSESHMQTGPADYSWALHLPLC